VFEKDEAKITDKMGLILKGIRLQKGFSREIIAERAKIGVRHLAAIENEQRAPSIEVFCRIVRALGISADRVVYPEDEVEESEEVQLVLFAPAMCEIAPRLKPWWRLCCTAERRLLGQVRRMPVLSDWSIYKK
jgi:transcriptional regulator with XRE-family HTH domain